MAQNPYMEAAPNPYMEGAYQPPQGGGGQFAASFDRGVDQAQLMGYAFAKAIGDATGADLIGEWGEEGIQRNLEQIAKNPPKVESWDDVESLATFGDYVIERLGEQAPMLLATIIPGMAAGSALASVGGRAALSTATKALVGKAIKRRIGYKAFDEFVRRRGAAALAGVNANPYSAGFVAGAAAPSFALNAGETNFELLQQGVNDPGEALTTGALKSVLDVIGAERVVGVARRLGRPTTGVLDRITRAAQAAGVAGTTEGLTEGAQTALDLLALNDTDPNFDLMTVDSLKKIREAVIAGGLTGAAFGGGLNMAAANPVKEKVAEADQELDSLLDSLAEGPQDEQRPTGPQQAAAQPAAEAAVSGAAAAAATQEATAEPTAVEQPGSAPDAVAGAPTAQDPLRYVDSSGRLKPEFYADRLAEIRKRAEAEGRELSRAERTEVEELNARTHINSIAGAPRVDAVYLESQGMTPEQAQEFLRNLPPEDDNAPEGADMNEEPAGDITSFVQSLPRAYQTTLRDILKNGSPAFQRKVVEAFRREFATPQTRARFLRDANSRWTAEVYRDQERNGRPDENIQFADEAPQEDQYTGDENEVDAGRMDFEPGTEDIETQLVITKSDNRGGEGHETEDSARSAIRTLERREPDPNIEFRVVQKKRRDRDEPRFWVQRVFYPGSVTPELNVSDSLGTRRTERTSKHPKRSETQFVRDALAVARKRAESTAHSIGLKLENLENVRSEQAQRFRRGILIVRRPQQDIDARKNSRSEWKLHIEQLARSGRDLNNTRGIGVPTNELESLLLGYETMLNELTAAGYDVSDALERVEKPRPARGSNQAPGPQQFRLRQDRILKAGGRYTSSDVERAGRNDATVADAQAAIGKGRQAPEEFENETPETGTFSERGRNSETGAREITYEGRLRNSERGTPGLPEQAAPIIPGDVGLANQGEELAQTTTRDEELSSYRQYQAAARRLTGETNVTLDGVQAERTRRASRASKREAGTARARREGGEAKVSKGGRIEAFGEGWSQVELDYLDSILAELGLKLDAPLKLFNAQELIGNERFQRIGRFTDKHLEQVRDRLENFPGWQARAFRNGTIVMRSRINNKGDSHNAARLLILGHELGHHVMWAMHDQLSAEQKQRLQDAWTQDKRKKGAPDDWYDDFKPGHSGYTEWFADKVSARAHDLTSRPTSLVDKIFRDIAVALQKLWNSIKGRLPLRFHKNKTFDDVIEQWKSADVYEDSRAVAVIPDEAADIMWSLDDVASHVSNETLKKFSAKVKDVVNGGAKMKRLGVALFTADGRLRAIDKNLAEKIYHASNTKMPDEVPFHTGVEASRALWKGQLERILRPYRNRPEFVEQIYDELAQELPDAQLSPPALRIREMLDRFFDTYLHKYIPDLKKEKNYFPRGYSAMDISARYDEFISILEKHGIDIQEAKGIADTLIRQGPPEIALSTQEVREKWMKERTIKSPALVKELVEKGFLSRDPYQAVMNYIDLSVRRAEYNRLFGDWVDVSVNKGVVNMKWKPGAKLMRYVNALPTDKRQEAFNLVERSVFPTHLDPNDPWHAAIGELKAYEAWRVLLGSGLASLPETAAIFLRTKGSLGFGDFMKEVRSTIKDWDSARDLAGGLGQLHDTMGSMLTEMVGDSPALGKRGFFQKHLPKLFKWNGNDFIVDFSRVLASQVGRIFLVQQAQHVTGNGPFAEQAKRYLAELGIEGADIGAVSRWAQRGQPLWSDVLPVGSQERSDTEIVQRALTQFINEAVIRPNASERPTWSQHPLGALVFHLKTFAYSFNKTVLGGLARELDARIQKGDNLQDLVAYAPFLAAAFMLFMVLGGASDELRQRIFSLGQKGTLESGNNDPDQVLTRWADRAGFMSMPYFDLVTKPGAESVAFAAGPSAHHFYELLYEDYGSDNTAIKALKSMPIVSQLPSVRAELTD